MSVSLLWFRRDLRLGDNPALLSAAAGADQVLPVFVLDDTLRQPSGLPRLTFLYRCLRALDESMGGRLVVLHGRPEEVIARVAREQSAISVHVAADFGPYGRRRDEAVEKSLGGGGPNGTGEVPLVRTGSPYAVAPGRVLKGDGAPFQVFTPFSRAWREHGWRSPAASPGEVAWATGTASAGIPADPELPAGLALPVAGEAAGLTRWQDFRTADVTAYRDRRNFPGADRTSRLSPYLKYGCVHPRTLLADLADASDAGATTYRTELCWREFYADVLWHRPESARTSLRPSTRRMRTDTGPDAERRLAAWKEGRTGYPIVDAGMRQLQREAWVHNRLRMIVASFLVKDLHLDWQLGARHFLQHLVDGDLASNNHGWQWVAGTGTDSAPYHRVFNPLLQGNRFDPDGDYVRRYVSELAHVPGAAVHEPWKLPAGVPAGYPERIIEHAQERVEALRRYGEISQ